MALHLFALAWLGLCPAHSWAAAPLVLRSGDVGLELDADHGAITRVHHGASGLTFTAPPGLAENFRITLVQTNHTRATLLGREQRLSSTLASGASRTLRWDGPLRDTTGAAHDLDVQMQVEADAGALTFTLHVENRTSARVREVWYPLVGGLGRGAAAERSAEAQASVWIPTSTPIERPITRPHTNVAAAYPGQMNLSFICIRTQPAGPSVYFAAHDLVARHKTYHVFQETGAGTNDVVAAVQFQPFTAPGASFDGPPVVWRFLEGDWPAAGRVYREWFERAFGIVPPAADWIRQQSFFLMTMFMLPEGTINYTFKDIPRWARSARRCGLGAVQISGWQPGGHDNGYPDYTIDPRLGTWAELEDGIRACHRMGLKVYFFVNYQPMMVDSDWYRRELHRYREMREDGGHTWMAGWGMGTLRARLGHPKLMTWANLAFPEYRRIIVEAFARLARIGADGVHVDKMFPAGLDFNPDSPLSPDTATWEGAIQLSREIRDACRQYNPDWAMSFECNWDRLLEFGAASWWVGNQRITRRIFPEHAETLGLYQAFDYLGVNNAVRDGHIVMVAPLNFSRDLDWPPFRGLARYIHDVKRVRDRLADAVFFGEILGPEGLSLPEGLPDGVQFNLFRDGTRGRRVCILTNSRREARQVAVAGFEGSGNRQARLWSTDRRPRVLDLPAVVAVPGERLLFLEELGGPP